VIKMVFSPTLYLLLENLLNTELPNAATRPPFTTSTRARGSLCGFGVAAILHATSNSSPFWSALAIAMFFWKRRSEPVFILAFVQSTQRFSSVRDSKSPICSNSSSSKNLEYLTSRFLVNQPVTDSLSNAASLMRRCCSANGCVYCISSFSASTADLSSASICSRMVASFKIATFRSHFFLARPPFLCNLSIL